MHREQEAQSERAVLQPVTPSSAAATTSGARRGYGSALPDAARKGGGGGGEEGGGVGQIGGATALGAQDVALAARARERGVMRSM